MEMRTTHVRLVKRALCGWGSGGGRKLALELLRFPVGSPAGESSGLAQEADAGNLEGSVEGSAPSARKLEEQVDLVPALRGGGGRSGKLAAVV